MTHQPLLHTNRCASLVEEISVAMATGVPTRSFQARFYASRPNVILLDLTGMLATSTASGREEQPDRILTPRSPVKENLRKITDSRSRFSNAMLVIAFQQSSDPDAPAGNHSVQGPLLLT
jgi:hypothetical protein